MGARLPVSALSTALEPVEVKAGKDSADLAFGGGLSTDVSSFLGLGRARRGLQGCVILRCVPSVYRTYVCWCFALPKFVT